MSRLPASVRLSLVLATLTVSIVILGDFVGVVPDTNRTALDARAKLAESLAVQFSLLAQSGELGAIERSIEALVDRNADVLSAALRSPDGTALAETGQPTWPLTPSMAETAESTATDVRVPIFRDNELWATVEIEFSRLDEGGVLSVIKHPLLRMILFFSVAGFLSYVLFLRRALKDLDPAAVVPERVKAAMDALAEGVLFLDEKEQIVLVNKAFSDKLGRPVESLLGTAASDLSWTGPRGEDMGDRLPWASVLTRAGSRTGGALTVSNTADENLTFSVNCASIIDPRGNVRGALVTFDDLTELQRKNSDLQDALEMLEASQTQIKRQNRKLEFLATRDPLTSCLNRRSFVERFTKLFERAVAQGTELSCVMVDIDHFKSVNDRYGHSTGDLVIGLVGQMLNEAVRHNDLVCRYGGEEFCLVLPDMGTEDARLLCDGIRVSLPDRTREQEALPSSATLTASFGLTSLSLGATTIEEMLEQADKSLYAAKDRGRNGVIGWGDAEARRPPEASPVGGVEGGGSSGTLNSETGSQTASPVIDCLDAGEVESATSPDHLSGVRSRARFDEEITRAARHASSSGTLAAVLILDLGNFEASGGAVDQSVSGELLRELDLRWWQTLRSPDSVALTEGKVRSTPIAKYGLRHFGLLLSDLTNMQSGIMAVRLLMDCLSPPVVIEGQEVKITPQIGVSVCPLDGARPGILVKRASAALKRMKSKGTRGYLFSREQAEGAPEVDLEAGLHHALARNELRLSYQPTAELVEGKIVAMEALLRWEHTELGLLQPGQFIGVAERAGLIKPIGSWVLREACDQARSWHETGCREQRVSVNVSLVQFCSAEFREEVRAVLEDTGLPPECLEIELNEALLLQNSESCASSAEKLRRIGVRVSIDDFARGAFAREYFQGFPADTIKVDRSLVLGLADSSGTVAKLGAIVTLAHDRGVEVVAKGVETAEQVELLELLGCDRIQGYLLSPPVTPAKASDLLAIDRRLSMASPPERRNKDGWAEAS